MTAPHCAWQAVPTTHASIARQYQIFPHLWLLHTQPCPGEHSPTTTQLQSHAHDHAPTRFAGLRYASPSSLKQVQGEFKHAMAEAFKSSPSAVFVIPTSPFPLLPTKPSMDALVGYRDRVTSLTCVAGMAGLPQVVVPMGTDMQGHEVTVSLVGSPGGDGLLLEMAGMLHGRLRQAWEVVKGHVKEEKRKMAEGEKKAHAKQAR